MAQVRPYRRPRLPLALALSATAQAGALLVFEATRKDPDPVLTIHLVGEGAGQVLVTREGRPDPVMRCDGEGTCRMPMERGTQLHLVALPSDGMTFEGWGQLPIRTPPKLQPYLGDPLKSCLDFSGPIDPTKIRDVLDCPLALERSVAVEVRFGVQPEEVDVEWAKQTDTIAADLPTEPVPPKPIDAEKLEEIPLEVAIAPIPKELKVPPPIPPPPPPPQQAPPPTPKTPPPPPPNMRMVEVPDQNEVDKAPDDATHLSDKNRDVAEETHAKETNLEKESKGEATASAKSEDTTSSEVGGPDDKIRQLEEARPTTDDRVDPTDHSGHSHEAEGQIIGEQGDDGDDGTGDNNPALLAMRGITGRGRITEQGDGKRRGKQGPPGIMKQLDFDDYNRIMGKDAVEKEVQVARRAMSAKKGRWERKLEAIKSSLENFTPDVRPGNQTALKTRAHPFALYVARMHRRIHELWGFGYLEDLDRKSADDDLNDFDLFVNIELSLNPDGTVHKTTIAKTSGKLEFDVAALDTVLSAGPYDATPEAIRSVDQRVYLRWGFYRNWRQCGTFNVEPYILTEIPGGIEPIDDGKMVKSVAKRGDQAVTPTPRGEDAKPSPSTSVKDDKALYAANLWVSGFSTAQVDKLVRFSATPFRAGGTVAATTVKDLETMYEGLLVESGKLKDWKLLTGDEYARRVGSPVEIGDDSLLVLITTQKTTFAIVMTKMKSGDFRATQLVR